jgi:hypothetical protein
MEQHQTIKAPSQGVERVYVEKQAAETRAKKSAEFKRLKATSTEEKKPSCWDAIAAMFRPRTNKLAG